MSDEQQAHEQQAHEQRDIGTKVHGDKLAHPSAAGRTAAAPDALAAAGDEAAIDPDHPDRTSEPGTGGLMPGSYEQAGGEGGHRAGERGVAHEDDVIRAPGSRVPDPRADPRQRAAALGVAKGTNHP